jgi:hypothetical protein
MSSGYHASTKTSILLYFVVFSLKLTIYLYVQHWIKGMRNLRDEEGYVILNKVTGECIKPSSRQGHPVKLLPYNPAYQDDAVLCMEPRHGQGISLRAHGEQHLPFVHFSDQIICCDVCIAFYAICFIKLHVQ